MTTPGSSGQQRPWEGSFLLGLASRGALMTQVPGEDTGVRGTQGLKSLDWEVHSGVWGWTV